MTEAVQSLQALLGRISGFFDIFDLSFIVSGASSLTALLLVYKLHGPTAFPEWVSGGYGGALIVLGCYVLGILSFVLGRLLRRLVMLCLSRASFATRLARSVGDAVLSHELSPKADDDSPQAKCLRILTRQHTRGTKPIEPVRSTALRLYTMMWTQVRQQAELTPSQVLLNRYWVMAALCDGMIVSSLLWTTVICASSSRLQHMQLGFLMWIGLALSLLSMGLFLKEAERYSSVQVDDLVSTLAFLQSRPMAQTVVRSSPSDGSASSASSAPASSAPASSASASAEPSHPGQPTQ